MVIQSRSTPPDWTDEDNGGEFAARCFKFDIFRDVDGIVRNDSWFQAAEEALPICNGDYIGTPCPVRARCLYQALVNNDANGVWGGMTGPQRRWIRRNVTKDKWTEDEWLRDNVPAPDYFKDLGDEDPDWEEEDFKREQEAGQAEG